MTNTGSDSANKPVVSDAVEEEMHVYEDEINLMDYFLVLWKHKWLILVCSVLPTLIVGLGVYRSPRNYKVTYTYDVKSDARDDAKGYVGGYDIGYDRGYDRGGARDYARSDVSGWNLNEKNFNVLQSRFYSKDNLNKIIDKLKTNKLNDYAEQIRNLKTDASNRFVEFEVSPSFVDISKLEVTDPGQLAGLRDMEAFLLNMTITGKPPEDLGKIALAIRDNFEEVVPLYMVQEQLSTDIRGYNSKQADIENSRYRLKLDLENNIEILADLKNIDIATLDEKRGEVVLQFDVGVRSEYLPLPYQIQAVESKIVEQQSQIKAGVAKHKYYEELSGLNARMVSELNDKLSSGQIYTMDLFRLFLTDLIGKIEKPQLKDYLASYIKKIENRIAVSVPVTENPTIYPIAKGTVKKSGLVFVLALMMSVFASFLLEGLKQNKLRNEK